MANGLENKAFDFMREGATKSFKGFIEIQDKLNKQKEILNK